MGNKESSERNMYREKKEKFVERLEDQEKIIKKKINWLRLVSQMARETLRMGF